MQAHDKQYVNVLAIFEVKVNEIFKVYSLLIVNDKMLLKKTTSYLCYLPYNIHKIKILKDLANQAWVKMEIILISKPKYLTNFYIIKI